MDEGYDESQNPFSGLSDEYTKRKEQELEQKRKKKISARQRQIHKVLLLIGSRPSDHYFRSVCWCLSVCLSVCVEFFSAVFDPISIKLGHMLYVWV